MAHSNEIIFITFYSYCLQTIIIGNSFKKLYQKLVLRVSSGVPNTSKQWKHSACGLVLSSVSRCLEPWWNTRTRLAHLDGIWTPNLFLSKFSSTASLYCEVSTVCKKDEDSFLNANTTVNIPVNTSNISRLWLLEESNLAPHEKCFIQRKTCVAHYEMFCRGTITK